MSGSCSCGCGCDCGCCEGVEAVTPKAIANRPGLDAIGYRIGTHSSFLETMRARLASHDFPALAGLTTRDGDDFSLALLDSWALVADVLTFYQERIANEGYLRTATERRSVLELARLIGYAPRPGVAASTGLAFTLEEKVKPAVAPGTPAPASASLEEPEVVVPAGSRAQSVPGPGEMPQPFETSEDLVARAAWNRLQPRLTRPQQPGEILFHDWTAGPATLPLYLKGISTQLKPNDPLLAAWGESAPTLFRVRKVAADVIADRTRVEIEPWLKVEQKTLSVPTKKTTTLGSAAVMASLSRQPGPQPSGGPERDAETLLAPGADLSAHLLTVARPELRDVLYKAWANVPVVEAPALRVCALRTRASVFGHNAPLELLRGQGGIITGSQEWWLPEPNQPGVLNLASGAAVRPEKDDVLFLDNAYPQILPGSWVVLERPDAKLKDSPLVIARAKQVKETSRSAYSLSGKSTQVQLDRPWLRLEGPELDTFAVVRGTAVYAQCEELAVAEAPIEQPVCGATIELARLYDGLQPGRWLIVSGERADVGEFEKDRVDAPVPGIPAAELVLLARVDQGVSSAKGANNPATGNPALSTEQPGPDPGEVTHTTLTLAQPLAYCYKRDTLTIYGNVAHATHGETRYEALGGGDGSKAFQAFTLKQPPLTWISAPTTSGIDSTLTVRVNDVRWHLAASIAGLGPADRSYVLRTDDGGQTTVVFGNGERGARLPTGSENVRATYRSGIGKGGNVQAGQISQLATRPLGVKDVINPLPATGGADRESRDQARRNAPLAVLALDRLISVQDYEDFSRTFAGVGKASAVRLSDGRSQLVHVTIAGEDDIPIAEGSDLLLNLEAALRTFGDPHEYVRVERRARTFLVLQAEVRLLPDYFWDAVEPKIRAALLAAFSFDRRGLGQDALLSRVYATVQAIPGVDLVDVNLFAQKDPEDLASVLDKGKTPSPDLPAPRLRARLARVEKGVVLPAQLLYLTPEVPDTLILKERKS
jgi:predicted phage baseplate assembly protein